MRKDKKNNNKYLIIIAGVIIFFGRYSIHYGYRYFSINNT